MERISVTVPEQPPVGTVVLDSHGTAWQATRAMFNPAIVWRPADTSDNALPWPALLVDHGPLDVVHRGEVIP